MSIINNENILKVLNAYNQWWKTGKMPQGYSKSMKRFAYHESEKAFKHKQLRRFVILSGTRRVGKTTIMYQQIETLLNEGANPKNILYVSFDNPLLKFCTINDIADNYMSNILYDENQDIYLFLDEIQYAQDWNNWLKVFYDTNPSWRIVATGSASPVLDKGMTESGTGRWITIKVPTLSFYEYLELAGIERIENNGMPADLKIHDLQDLSQKEFNNIVNMLESLQKHFIRYITVGGFPELVLSTDDMYAQRILRDDIADKVLKRDIPALFGIRNVSILEKLFLYLCFNSSNIINYTTMSQALENVSVPTLQDYVDYLERANLIYISEPIGAGGKQILKAKPKIYIVDSAIRNAVLMKDDISTDPVELGYVVETAVFRHILALAYRDNAKVGYFRDAKNDKEIDIVLQSVKNRMYVEVKYRDNSGVKTDNPLYNIAEKNDRVFVITKNSADCGVMQLESGVPVVRIPVCAFLYLIGMEEYKGNI
ncbi:MAG: ATP-binding protein [Oscillospiraceae bacterium]|nr:ATP-binding protein [Oscillospiraceae bacterium]